MAELFSPTIPTSSDCMLLEFPTPASCNAAHETPIGDLIRGALLIAEILDADAMINHVEFL